MTAKGKINASKVQINDRIIVDTAMRVYGGDECGPSRTKTGETVQVGRVLNKLKPTNDRGYIIVTNLGRFYAEPIQTMWLAPEDAAGIKRAYAEAQAEDNDRAVTQAKEELEQVAEELKAADEAGVIGTATFQRLAEIHDAARICTRRSFSQPPMGHLALSHLADIRAALAKAAEETPAEPVGADNDAHLPVAGVEGTSLGEMRQAFRDEDETETPAVREATGSSVVKLLERVHQRIRQNHPEVPEVVIVTGAGIGMGGSNKWGHFRPRGWTALGEFVPEANEHSRINLHEMFMAGETLARGAHQVLQTMLHESAHALAEHRGEKDTSRQGRWHNATFRKTAEELGLEYKGGKADKTLGFSAVTLTAETIKEYADLLDELETEIHLMVRLPGWLGGSDDDQDDNGGENMGKAPKGTETKSTSNVKLTCLCEEPNIIRASKKVADKTIIRCDDCHALFLER
jgi:hypothetical protein